MINLKGTFMVFFAGFLLNQGAAQENWEVGFGLQAQAGLVYSGEWDPGWSASGAEVTFRQSLDSPWGPLSFRLGLEYAGAGLGSQISLPLGLFWSPFKAVQPGLSWSLGFQILPGLTLTRPRPLFLWGTEAGGEIRWTWENGWHAGLGASLRQTSCPEYSARGTEYTLWDVPVRLGVGWSPRS